MSVACSSPAATSTFPARTPSSGSGLGLAIADDIVRRCGGTIALENAREGGAQVALTFPLLPVEAAAAAVGVYVEELTRASRLVTR